jgi:hypothetical protein
MEENGVWKTTVETSFNIEIWEMDAKSADFQVFDPT